MDLTVMKTPAAPRPLLLASALSLALAACGQAPAAGAQTKAGPVETRPPNGTGQSPAFPGQTRAPQAALGVAYQTRVVAGGLDHPWAIAFLPGGDLLVTERVGRLRRIARDGTMSPALTGLPPVAANGQGGLFDLALDPHFATNHLVYFSYFEPRGADAGLSVARGVLDRRGLTGAKVLFRALPADPDDKNIGGRLAFLRDGTLMVTVGDRFHLKDDAQTLDNDLGKLVRINADGTIPKDNPFLGKPGARPEIYSYGQRNPEGLAVDPRTGDLWEVEHGAKGGDEINRPQPGKNYGWPVIAYGIDYSGEKIGAGITQKAGMEQPLYYWDPVIAPSGLSFYDGALFPRWKGSLFVGSLKEKHVARLDLKGDRVVGEERLLTEIGKRIRDVRPGPDGALYILTDDTDGQVIRVTPK
jgi:glucose/arabinose dehydrogenase